MNILALDLATTTGWAIRENGRLESGTQKFDLKRGESPGMRYLRFNRWLAQVAASRPQLIVYEQAHNRGGAATEIANGLVTRVLELCAEHGINHSSVHSSTLKKWATGRGNAKKPDMIEAAQRWKPGVTSDDEADALALLHYAEAELI